jgi:serine/threonine-protein kinase
MSRTTFRQDDEPTLVLAQRYALLGEFASGGMATVHFGRLLGSGGFSRTVAIKRLHPHFAKATEFAAMLIDEARLVARVAHPNVVPILDVVEERGEVFLIMEYVHGESLAQLVRLAASRGGPIPPGIACSIACGLLHGLHAAHEATNEAGEPLGIVHRDVSPQNALVGSDGVTRVLDFGIARAIGRLQTTGEGRLKGKSAYLAPERILGREADRRSDVYGAAVVLWETLTGTRLFDGESDAVILKQVLSAPVPRPSSLVPAIPAALEAITLRGLDRDPEARFPSARDMALALQREIGVLAPSEVGDWVSHVASESLAARARCLAEIDRVPSAAGDASPGARRAWRGQAEPATRVFVPEVPPDARPAGAGRSEDEDAPDAPSRPISAQNHSRTWKRSRARAAAVVVTGLAAAAMAILGGVLNRPAPARAPAVKDVAPSRSTGVETANPYAVPEQRASAEIADPAPARPDTVPVVVDSGNAAARPALPGASTLPAVSGATAPSARSVARAAAAAAAASAPSSIGSARADRCSPPYTLDADGTKRFKVDCLVDVRR